MAIEEGSEEGSSSGTQTSSLIDWPSIKDFTIAAGISSLCDLVSTWDYEEDWLYCIDFLFEQSDDSSDFYTYEVN